MGSSSESFDERLVKVVPSKRQLEYEKLEFTGFLHFTVNTFTDREWGDGTESEEIFNPTKLDAGQWVKTCKKAGMKGVILTCKHHDGFCLWPSKYTKHSVAFSPYKNGKGDIVKEVSNACREEGIRFGVYLSPWDRNQETYGQGKAYDDYYINQLTELLTNYGEIYTVWLDGACGEGANGKKQYYDWDRIFKTIRELMPNACINICGPDIRWCGNEGGWCRKSEWSVVPERTSKTEYTASLSQQVDDESFRLRKIKATDEDLGSRELLLEEENLIWYPAEVDTSIRPGWFYHESEDDKVKSAEELFELYCNSVGGNSSLLLNVPPNREGLIAKRDALELTKLGNMIREAFAKNIADEAVLTGSEGKAMRELANVRNDSDVNFYEPLHTDELTVMIFDFNEEKELNYLVMRENIADSQRVESFKVLCKKENHWQLIYEGTVIGYKKIVRLCGINTTSIKIVFTDYRVCPEISFVGIY